MTPPRAVVFDFDGVLADTELLHLRALRESLATRGWSLSDEDYFSYLLGYDDRGCVIEFARRNNLTVDAATIQTLLREKERRYAALFNEGQVLYPQVRACLERLSLDRPLAIASGSLRGEIERILDANQLRSYFQVIVGANDVSEGKPAPESYVKAVSTLGIPSSEAVAIEDSPWGLRSARDAGLRTIGITTSYRSAALSDAMYVISSLDELTPALIASL